jgi:hypothetical protein
MLWARKLQEVHKAVTKALTLFLKSKLPGVDVPAVAEDILRNAIRVDMSRSATRLRRRLYAQWGKYNLVPGELVRLSPGGLEMRPPERDPLEVGELHLDPFRVAPTMRLLQSPKKKTRLSHGDCVRGWLLATNAVISCSRSSLGPLQESCMAVLAAVHAVERDRLVDRGQVLTVVKRILGQWKMPVPLDAQIQADLEVLERHGYLKACEAPDQWRLSDRVSYPW